VEDQLNRSEVEGLETAASIPKHCLLVLLLLLLLLLLRKLVEIKHGELCKSGPRASLQMLI
jgi:hypothetical protein